MVKKILISAAVLLGAAALCFGQGQQLPQLPNDPETRVGKLDNGLTYYIRHNDKPADRAEFYLATNVGAIQETPDQDGLAHFLEHMCFNGTKNFPGKSILNWLESIGASFGGNVNASTGVEQTIYLLNNIPLVRPTVVDTCLLIMHDYSHFVTCDPEEIDKERGVILEEKRSRNTASWRLHEKTLPYLYGDTKYAGCTIIGSEDNLKNFKPESLTNFYHTWYRPDMQALIVVGDINVDEVEAKIKKIFSDIPAAENPKAKDVITIPDNEKPVIGIITDPETSTSTFEVYWKSAAQPEELNSTAVGLMAEVAKSLIGNIMAERFGDISAKPDAPFLYAGFGITNVCETMDVAYGEVSCKEGAALQGFEAMLTEIEKMHRFGFTDSEFERAKNEVLSQYETAANKADTRKNAEFVMPMIMNFFDNYSFMDPKTEYQMVQALMAQFNTSILNQLAQQLITRNNMVVIYSGPEKEGAEHPDAGQVQAIIDKVENAEYTQEAGEEIPTAFLDPSTLKGSKIKKTVAGLYGSEVLTLKNGVKVILLPSDREKDKVNFNIFKRGGQSLISDEDLYSFEDNIWALYQQNTGVAGFPATTVRKMLSGKQVAVSPYIGEYTHGVSATSTTKDLETAFQLMYLYFTSPRFDPDEYANGITQIENVLPNLENQPNWQLQKQLAKTIYDSPRDFTLDKDVLAKASLQTLEKNYRRLFKDAAGATLVVVGDFDRDTILPLVERYAGSLAKGKKATNWEYRNDGIIDGRKVNDFRTPMQTPMVTVVQIYKADKPYSVKEEVDYTALSYILNMVYTETLREEEGGTYGASASAQLTHQPYETRLLQVAFQTNEEQCDKLRELAVKGMEDLAKNGPDAEKFDKAKKNLEKTVPENKLRNAWWSSALQDAEKYGINYVVEYEAAVEALTPDSVKKAAEELLASGNFIELVMRPEVK